MTTWHEREAARGRARRNLVLALADVELGHYGTAVLHVAVSITALTVLVSQESVLATMRIAMELVERKQRSAEDGSES